MLFDFEGALKSESSKKSGGCSSAGRAPALHAGGQEFEPPHLHQEAEGEESRDPLTGMGA